MKKMWKGLRRFFKRSDRGTNVNFRGTQTYSNVFFYSAQQYKNDSHLMCVFVFISLIVTYTGSFNKKRSVVFV